MSCNINCRMTSSLLATQSSQYKQCELMMNIMGQTKSHVWCSDLGGREREREIIAYKHTSQWANIENWPSIELWLIQLIGFRGFTGNPISNQFKSNLWATHYFMTFMLDEWDVHSYAIIPSLQFLVMLENLYLCRLQDHIKAHLLLNK